MRPKFAGLITRSDQNRLSGEVADLVELHCREDTRALLTLLQANGIQGVITDLGDWEGADVAQMVTVVRVQYPAVPVLVRVDATRVDELHRLVAAEGPIEFVLAQRAIAPYVREMLARPWRRSAAETLLRATAFLVPRPLQPVFVAAAVEDGRLTLPEVAEISQVCPRSIQRYVTAAALPRWHELSGLFAAAHAGWNLGLRGWEPKRVVAAMGLKSRDSLTELLANYLGTTVRAMGQSDAALAVISAIAARVKGSLRRGEAGSADDGERLA
jgi:hypothetical protein